LQVELLNTRMQSMGLEPVTGPQSLEILLQDESNRQFLDDIRSRADISVDVTAELQTVRRRSREREQECLKLQQEIQALQSLVSRLQEEMLELHTERDHYQVNDFFFTCPCLASCNETQFLVQFFSSHSFIGSLFHSFFPLSNISL
jgi:hypothetical protein